MAIPSKAAGLRSLTVDERRERGDNRHADQMGSAIIGNARSPHDEPKDSHGEYGDDAGTDEVQIIGEALTK